MSGHVQQLVKIKHYFLCVVCGEHEFFIEHLIPELEGKLLRPWRWICDCGAANHFTITRGEAGALHVTVRHVPEHDMPPATVVLSFTHEGQTVYLLVAGRAIGEDPEDSARYFYGEHTCPTNWTSQIRAVIAGTNDDPHGLFQFERLLPPMPEQRGSTGLKYAWASQHAPDLFPPLKEDGDDD